MIRRAINGIDWILIISIVPMFLAGLATMTSFGSEGGFFGKQLLWIGVALIVMFTVSRIDLRFFRQS